MALISGIEKSSIGIPSGFPFTVAEVKFVSKYAETVRP
jgi:hypothetical protein